MNEYELVDLMPIQWFGDRETYQKSDIKIITVGLNPSEIEFKNDENVTDIHWRFPDCIKNNENSYRTAWNNYFKINPYQKWFNAFETVLNGCQATYGGKMKGADLFSNRCALHTDLCSPYATTLAWSKLPNKVQKSIYNQRLEAWKALINDLKPDLIIISVAHRFIKPLICNCDILHTFVETKDHKQLNKPICIKKGYYNDIPVIMGTTRNIPFGNICNDNKLLVGEKVLSYYNQIKQS